MNIESRKEEKNSLESFREEITAIKEKEMAKKSQKKDYNPHFEEINPEDLTEEDRLIYEKYKQGPEGPLTFKEISEYRKNVIIAVEKEKSPEIREEDRLMYEKFKKGEISRDKFIDYCEEKVLLNGIKELPELKDSRLNFCAWMINQTSVKSWLKKFSQEGK